MTVIGILAPASEQRIAAALKKLFARHKKRVAVVSGMRTLNDELYSLRCIGVDYCIILFKKGKIRPHYVDILILDNSEHDRLISYEVIKCISPDTRLIYNIDNGCMPLIEHPNAIDYGLNHSATATVSSVGESEEGVCFVFCLQRPVTTLYGERLEEGEMLVDISCLSAEAADLLPAVTCGMLCGLLNGAEVKI